MKPVLAIIGSAGIPARYGGFETLAHQLAHRMGDRVDLHVYCSGPMYPVADRQATCGDARLHYLPLQANGIQSVLYDALSILLALRYADVLLILGVSGAWVLPFVRLFTRKRILVNIDGLEWQRAKWNRTARWFLRTSEAVAARCAHAVIADNEGIREYVAKTYALDAALIAYGADHVETVAPAAPDHKRFPFMAHPYALKVARIEPENNLDLVLDAFANLPAYTLVIIGNWNHSQYGINLRSRYGAYENIHLLDPIYDQAVLDSIRTHAMVYIHGHSAGGTNPSLIEAMWLGLPILSYGVNFNRHTTGNAALYFDSTAELINLVQYTKYQTLHEMGKTMKTLARPRYRWSLVADAYSSLACNVPVPQSLSLSRPTAAQPEPMM